MRPQSLLIQSASYSIAPNGNMGPPPTLSLDRAPSPPIAPYVIPAPLMPADGSLPMNPAPYSAASGPSSYPPPGQGGYGGPQEMIPPMGHRQNYPYEQSDMYPPGGLHPGQMPPPTPSGSSNYQGGGGGMSSSSSGSIPTLGNPASSSSGGGTGGAVQRNTSNGSMGQYPQNGQGYASSGLSRQVSNGPGGMDGGFR